MSRHGPVVEVADLLGPDLSEVGFTILCAEHQLHRRIINPRVQKPGLAFAGYYDYIKPGRVQIVGESELHYLLSLDEAVLNERYAEIMQRGVPVFICTKGLEPPPLLVERAGEEAIPVLSSPALSSTVIKRVSYFLEERLVPSTTLHGVLLEIFGVGVLLIGSSGVGKSECALDLITRGHSLVADDSVTLRLYPSGEIVGLSQRNRGHHMELRGIGIINVQDLFGMASVRERKVVDLVIELEQWDEAESYDRLGLDESTYEILGTATPFIRMPVALGRHISILVEIAARNQLLKQQGHHSAQRFANAVDGDLGRRDAEE